MTAAGTRSTLLLRLSGPMQSWGTQSRFSHRDTGREPSKSGVVGLLCAALGRPRSEPVDDLAALRMGIRVEADGRFETDFQTAGGAHRRGERYGVVRASGSPGETVISQRHYLADAAFLVGLEGDDLALLHRLDAALARPIWPLCLGRKAFVPGQPVAIRRNGAGGVREGLDLNSALEAEPYEPPLHPRRRTAAETGAEPGPPPRLRLVLEHPGDAGTTNGDLRMDQPVGAAFAERRFAPRFVVTAFVTPPGLAMETTEKGAAVPNRDAATAPEAQP